MSGSPNVPYRIDPRRDILTPERIRMIEETRRFFGLLRRKPLVSFILLGIMVAFWVLTLVVAAVREPMPIMQWLGSLILGARAHQDVLVDLGAKVNFLVDQGQSFRLVAPLFLHFGLLHMLFNGYALYLLGRLIENIYGRRRFLLIFFVSGVASIAASFAGSSHISVGASGAIFGLLGAGTVLGYTHRDEIPPVFRRFFGRGLIPWIVLNLALGFLIDGIDNYAHIGGLVAGVLVSLTLTARIDPSREEPSANRALLSLASLGIILAFAATIVMMLSSLFAPAPLALPERWRTVKDERLFLEFRIPGPMIPVETENPDGSMQYGEPNFGFWVALERLSDTGMPLELILKELLREAEAEHGVDILSHGETSLAAYPARRIHLRLRPPDDGRRYDLEVFLASTSNGLLKVSCSAPTIHYGLFRRWCDAVADSLHPLELKKWEP